jgi:non-heme chloroperoxidase
MPYLQMSDGLPLYFEDHGSGSPIVFIPGWTLTTQFWKRQIADFSPKYRAVTLDLRGAGSSGKTGDGHSLSSYAADLEDLLHKLNLNDVTLVGFAMGVSVAVHNLVIFGGRQISRFVWVDHSPRFFRAPDWPYPLFGDFDPQKLDTTISRLRHDRLTVTRELLGTMFSSQEDWMLPELMKTPTNVATTMLESVANVDLRPLLPQLDLPVLLINGRRSVVPWEVGEWLEANLRRAQLVVIDDAGHAPFWDNPSQFNEAVLRFIART